MRKTLIAGNWKMNLTVEETEAFFGAFHPELKDAELLICPPFTDLAAVKARATGTCVKWGAQDVFPAEKGAYTGEISPGMLKALGCTYVICGHSERRQILGESDEFVARKVKAVLAAGMTPILCVGETREERQLGQTEERIGSEIETALFELTPEEKKNIVIAYEPIWAIGSGEAATPDTAESISAFIRGTTAKLSDEETADAVRILYGGSVTGNNIAAFLAEADIDGALVGGASLKPDAFLSIYNQA